MIFAQTVFIIFEILFSKLSFIKGASFEFIVENDEVFEPCSHIPNSNGIHDILDISDMVLEYTEGSINCQGNATAVWDIKTTDRIQVRCDVYKFQRGTWQPTPSTMVIKDLCPELFKPGTYWYNAWTHAIQKADRECLNNKGHIYHHDHFSLDTTFQVVYNVEGRYKLVIMLEAFDKNDVKNPSIACVEIHGETVKL